MMNSLTRIKPRNPTSTVIKTTRIARAIAEKSVNQTTRETTTKRDPSKKES